MAECPLLALSGHRLVALHVSAFDPKADIATYDAFIFLQLWRFMVPGCSKDRPMRTIHGSSTSMLSPYANRKAPRPMLRERGFWKLCSRTIERVCGPSCSTTVCGGGRNVGCGGKAAIHRNESYVCF
jgi:hypothetical protein